MKVAVTYANGEIFQHFGHTLEFKVYEIEGGAILSGEVRAVTGEGHCGMAGLLGEWGIDTLVCGGIGPGAQNALAAQGINLCAGVSGNADAMMDAFVSGRITPAACPSCAGHGDHGHHHHGGGGCGHHHH